jgi:hypothetical protein
MVDGQAADFQTKYICIIISFTVFCISLHILKKYSRYSESNGTRKRKEASIFFDASEN